MDIDFIKWMVGYAEGYHLQSGKYKGEEYDIIDYGEDRISLEEFSSCKSIALSLLIYKTIEGINKKSKYGIILLPFIVKLIIHRTSKMPLELFYEKDIQEINIEKVLKYIYEQEK